MCGIIGYVTKKPSLKYNNFMKLGLYLDTIRGYCGTGIYGWGNKVGPKVFKRALAGYDFLNSRQFEQFSKTSDDYSVVIGHNRASTIGQASDENCHPFVYDHIGFVHNGTLRGYHRLVPDKDFTHAVDSAYAAKALSLKASKEVLDNTDGPFVFVWHDSKENTFNIARNNNRDIWYIMNKEQDTLFFCSEYGMLNFILDRCGIDTGNHKYRNPGEHIHLSWDLSKGLEKPRLIKFEEYKNEWQRNARDTNGRWLSRGDENGYYGGRGSNYTSGLGKLGLRTGDQILVDVENWLIYDTYKHNPVDDPNGILNGSLFRHGRATDVSVRIHSVRRSKSAEFLESSQLVMARVTGYTLETKDGKENTIVTAIDPVLGATINGEKKKEEAGTEKQSSPSDSTRLYKGPEGKLYSAEAAQESLCNDCGYCGDPVTLDDLEKHEDEMKWVCWGASDWSPICPNCASTTTPIIELRNMGAYIDNDTDSDDYPFVGGHFD